VAESRAAAEKKIASLYPGNVKVGGYRAKACREIPFPRKWALRAPERYGFDRE